MGMIKGWKKKRDSVIIGNDRFIYYHHKKSDNDILIQQEFGGWTVHIRDNVPGHGTRRFIADKKFRDKHSALTFANRYMRTHPNG